MDVNAAVSFFGGGVRRLSQKGGGGMVLPSFRRLITVAALSPPQIHFWRPPTARQRRPGPR